MEKKARTTVRLWDELHDQLKLASAETGKSAEAIIRLALKSYLPHLRFGALSEHPHDWSPLLATRCVQFLPTPFVILDALGAIVYVNHAYEREFGFAWTQISGRKTEEFLPGTAVERELAKNEIARLLNSAELQTKESVESITYRTPDPLRIQINNETVAVYRCVRWTFVSQNKKYLGEFILRWAGPPEKGLPTTKELCTAVLKSAVSPSVQDLIETSVESSPLTMLVKNASSGAIVWYNQIFADFLKSSSRPFAQADILGKTSQQVLGVSDVSQLVTNDFHVKTHNEAVVVDQRLSTGKEFRRLIRFPIPGPPEGEVEFIGVLSTDFGLSSHGL